MHCTFSRLQRAHPSGSLEQASFLDPKAIISTVQKQMGRPRKRPRGEAEVEEPEGSSSDAVPQVHIQEAVSFEPLPGLDLDSFNFDFNIDPSLGMDLDLSLDRKSIV